MTRRSVVGSVLAVALTFGVGARAAEASSFTLNHSGSLGSGPFGTIVVTQFAVNVVDVLVTLNPNIGFVDTGNGNNHPDFAWSLANNPVLTQANITIVQSGANGPWVWDLQNGPINASDGIGTFMYALNCTRSPAPPGFQRCGNGGTHPDFGPLEFRIALTGITPNSFVPTGEGVMFAADVLAGTTGLVWTTEQDREIQVVATPEPGTMILLGSGLAFAARRLRRGGKNEAKA